ncbi:hypothetical protein EV193_102596 [Herbihabitans rhizosphaerae]|uniref:Heme oxygenase-like protein n=1 Tax=Herbihabitans rhizosphaerae TaxID=1872711 RepID=A0A4Q7L305_9PSEU|nr:hypothetical protein [Herbihabitans rhizosphaerae]RZS43615.1 hypothetical protein EV193_102596 [Herbihabitans rhizosphaerae]
MNDLDEFENAQIERFRQHAVFRELETLPEPTLHALLLQRRFVSLAFTAFYDLAIDLLTDERAAQIARVILREEYPDDKAPGRTPSHRELMRDDILRSGVSREALVASRPSEATKTAITGALSLIATSAAADHPDVRLVTCLRFWGEILVSVEYEELWRRLESRLVVAGENRSTFYYPHMVHDAKVHPIAAASALSLTHSDQLGTRLSELLDSPAGVQGFRETESAIVELKSGFYDQFLPAA